MILAVLTCERPGRAAYAPGTLALLDAQRWLGHRLLWSDGPLVRRNGWESGGAPRQGPPNTFAFWDLLEAVRGHDLVFVEDDARPCPGALPYLARMGCPAGVSYVSWFDPICRRSNRLPRVRYFDAGEIIPCQARTFPAATIDRMIAFRNSLGWKPNGGSDVCIAAALRGSVAAVHQPSLFQHVGASSAVMPGVGLDDVRVSESWMGDLFNVDRSFAGTSADDLWGGVADQVGRRPAV